jgi:hypothetical protein
VPFGLTVKLPVIDFAPAAAVITAVWLVRGAPAFATKPALDAPDETITEVGTVTALLLDERVTEKALVAALFSVIVQVLLPLELTVVGLHDREDSPSTNCATNVSVTGREDAPYFAVTTAVVSELTEDAVAVKLAAMAFAGTTTDAGTVRLPLLLDSDTIAPLLGAGPLSPTVQEMLAGGVNEIGLQAKLVNVGASNCSATVFATPL